MQKIKSSFSFSTVEEYYEQQQKKIMCSLSSQYNHHPPQEAKGCSRGCERFGTSDSTFSPFICGLRQQATLGIAFCIEG